MRKPVLLALGLAFLALFFGWRTWKAWQADPGHRYTAAQPTSGVWQPGAAFPDPPPPADTTGAVSAITGRPLFRRDRQPFRDAPAVPLRNYEAELSRYTLLGVLAFGNEWRGLVVSRGGNRADRWELKAGESFPGFTVKEVRTDSLLVTADDREFQLPLYAGPPTATGGALRTEAPRVDAPRSPTTTKAVPAPRATAAPAQQPQPARPAAAPPAQGTSPQPAASPQQPVFTPRYVPGRR